jgi:hypothetical protein
MMTDKTIHDSRLQQVLALLDDARCLVDEIRENLPLGFVSHQLFQEHQRINKSILGVQSVMPVSYVPDSIA